MTTHFSKVIYTSCVLVGLLYGNFILIRSLDLFGLLTHMTLFKWNREQTIYISMNPQTLTVSLGNPTEKCSQLGAPLVRPIPMNYQCNRS